MESHHHFKNSKIQELEDKYASKEKLKNRLEFIKVMVETNGEFLKGEEYQEFLKNCTAKNDSDLGTALKNLEETFERFEK